MQRLSKLESKVDNIIYNGTSTNLTNGTGTPGPNPVNPEKVNVAGTDCLFHHTLLFALIYFLLIFLLSSSALLFLLDHPPLSKVIVPPQTSEKTRHSLHITAHTLVCITHTHTWFSFTVSALFIGFHWFSFSSKMINDRVRKQTICSFTIKCLLERKGLGYIMGGSFVFKGNGIFISKKSRMWLGFVHFYVICSLKEVVIFFRITCTSYEVFCLGGFCGLKLR